ncbi:hypothetical protein MASR1M31_05440 [Porphyromonadaceae bacterium]
MEANDIKDIWEAGVERNIKPYSEKEINEMVVKSARKSINTVYPGTIFRLVVIAVIVYLAATILFKEQSAEKTFLDMAALVITAVSYSIWERSAYKMKRYTNGMSVKEWLEYRIMEIEKEIKFSSKYNWVIYCCSFLCAIGIYVLYQIVSNTTPSILSVIITPLGIIIYVLIVRRSLNRNYKKTLHELKGIYEQFEDSNE